MAQLAEQLICNQQVIGSSPIIGLVLTGLKDFGPLAQLVEQRTENPRVAGSIPALGILNAEGCLEKNLAFKM